MFTTNKLVFTFGGFYVCANFVENPSRNVSKIVDSTCRWTHGQRRTNFIICPMLYAIAVGQITKTCLGVDLDAFATTTACCDLDL